MYSFWFVLIALLIIYLQKSLYKKYIFMGLEIKRSFSDKYLFPDDSSTLEITIINKKLLPISFGKILQRLPSNLVFHSSNAIMNINDYEYIHEAHFNILPFQKITRKYNIILQKRGHYELLSDIKIHTTNLLGTEDFTKSLSSDTSITVYPKLRDVKKHLFPANTLQGDVFIDRWIMEDPMMIKGIRNYQSNDPLKSVNWKATAKNQSLMVNEYDYTAERKIILIFDIGIPKNQFVSDSLPEVEDAIEVAASIATELISAGIPTGLVTNASCKGHLANTIISPDTGNEQASKILDLFGRISYYKSISISEVINLSMDYFTWGTEAIIVTPSLNNELISSLENFKTISITVISLQYKVFEYLPNNINLFFYSEEGENSENIKYN